jgi:hypothetical protein
MPYIGQQPTNVAFLTDNFSGNGLTTAFTLSAAPATTSSILVAVSGVLQDPSTYAVAGTTLTFSAAPPTGTSNISVRFLGIPASGVTTTAYRTVTEFTATSGQTTFSVPSYTVGYIDVYRNGVLLGSADYTATNGTTVVLAAGATAGDLVETISFYVSSVLNAVSPTGGTFSGNVLFASGNGIWNTSGNVGIGTSSPTVELDVRGRIRARKSLSMNGEVAGNPLMFDIEDQSGNTVLEIGRADNVSSLVAMDFHTGSTSTDYDTRIIASGGNGTPGNGILTYAASNVAFNGNLSFNSGYGSAATAYGCRAWVNFNGTGTPAIRASGNVSSITDNGTGDYTVNFTTAMPDANYSFTLGATLVTNGSNGTFIYNPTTSAPAAGSIRIMVISAGALYDSTNVCVAIFR